MTDNPYTNVCYDTNQVQHLAGCTLAADTTDYDPNVAYDLCPTCYPIPKPEPLNSRTVVAVLHEWAHGSSWWQITQRHPHLTYKKINDFFVEVAELVDSLTEEVANVRRERDEFERELNRLRRIHKITP